LFTNFLCVLIFHIRVGKLILFELPRFVKSLAMDLLDAKKLTRFVWCCTQFFGKKIGVVLFCPFFSQDLESFTKSQELKNKPKEAHNNVAYSTQNCRNPLF
jgi:hypothetical protein